ncbi:MAG TPA: MaoC family dehydratase [Ilumatobacter sp.]|nr:MaoC family dehydratase [Ilumatobacter sp.]
MFDTSKHGPLYEDFVVGATLPPLPSLTVTEADNVLYRAITGDQNLLVSDLTAYASASGSGRSLANPALVMQYSIGQTTMATRQAIANLYYRSVRVLAPVEVGDTLRTTTTVLGLKDSAPKGDQFRGKVWLGITTSTDSGPVIRYERCALVRGRGPGQPGHDDDIPGPSDPTPLADLADAAPSWDLSGLPSTSWPVGDDRPDPLRDHVDMAAPLARLTFNQAAVHRDFTTAATGARLVYGGHVQGLAQASLTRMLPGLATVVAWDGCDHIGPAFEGDLIEFRHRLVEELAVGSGRLMRFEVVGTKLADASNALETPIDILKWTPIAWAP